VTLKLGHEDQAARRTAHEFVREALRRAILRGNAPAGTRLVQADIAAELGVSTTPVREALRDLATEGLIDLDAHRGAVVRRLRFDDLVEIHELMRLLDPEAMRRAAIVGPMEHLEEAEELADRMEGERDVADWVQLNLSFHHLLSLNVDRKRLLGMLSGLRDTVAPYTALALQQEGYPIDVANRHHRQLIDAVRRQDPEAAAEVSAAHVDLTMQELERARALFDPIGEGFSEPGPAVAGATVKRR
jgi:DNA-binding GntR family transcriptional regulator